MSPTLYLARIKLVDKDMQYICIFIYYIYNSTIFQLYFALGLNQANIHTYTTCITQPFSFHFNQQFLGGRVGTICTQQAVFQGNTWNASPGRNVCVYVRFMYGRRFMFMYGRRFMFMLHNKFLKLQCICFKLLSLMFVSHSKQTHLEILQHLPPHPTSPTTKPL